MGRATRRTSALLLAAVAGCGSTDESLRKDLSAEDPEDRLEAAVEIGERRDAASLSELTLRLRVEDTPFVRIGILRALARLGEPGGVGPAAAALADPEPDVRAEAIRTLSALGAEERAADVTLRLREDEDPGVRAAAAAALGRLGALAAIPDLIARLADDDTVSVEAHRALERLTHRPLPRDPVPWRAWWDRWQAAAPGPESGSPGRR